MSIQRNRENLPVDCHPSDAVADEEVEDFKKKLKDLRPEDLTG